MANTGYRRAKIYRIQKTIGGDIQTGYPKEYDITDAFGFDDWFLPSIDELEQMYINLYLEGVGGFNGSARYGSSSELSADSYDIFSFLEGFSDPDTKDMSVLVRPARSFTLTESTYSYALRDTGPAGGLIFYRSTDGTTSTYYEAAPADLGSTYAYSDLIDDLIGTTSTAIGTGAANTLAIIAQGATAGAAVECAAYSVNFPALNDTEFAELPTADYNTRLAAFRANVSGIEGVDLESRETNEPRDENTTECPIATNYYTITFAIDPNSTGEGDLGNLDQSPAGPHLAGAIVELSASDNPPAGYFYYWKYNGSILSMNATYNFTMPAADVTIYAFYTDSE